nr:MAG TPA: SINGLE STRANDED DNA BINDING PROTEIN/RNA BARREL, PROTEIN-DNA COMPLEX, REPLICATION-RNA.2A [Caudoviricetes sp.]DAX78225.1 MAG TPA: SINGLE STRANDED DNA BINDING PROTEIN/RNA BARREL, PROTEIN-DNA COMPLEX, REPLICATION-RNA.2A [Caudoviricetes sp.]
MEIQGRIKTIFATETVGQNGFQKRDLVITTDGQYPQDIIIQFAQGNCALLDNLQIGQMVKIHFNLQGREWTSPQGEVKYFNTVVGWKIELIQTTNVAQQQQQAPQGYAQHPQGYPQQPQYAPPQQAAYPPQGQPQYQQGQMFNQYGQAPSQGDGIPY